MLKFETFEKVLDLAIIQEKAAQQLYKKLAGQVRDREVQQFYESLICEECSHEKKLLELKTREYAYRRPDLEDLENSGYLDALPVPEDITYQQAVKLALEKERSAWQLYTFLAERAQDEKLAGLFRMLASQESEHAMRFQKELEAAAIR